MVLSQPVLEVSGLGVSLQTGAGPLHAVRGTDFSLMPGEALGVVGESGSGKSMTALALMRLLPRIAKSSAQSIRFDGQDLTGISDADFARRIAGQSIAMIFQEPMTSLNPVYTIGRQMTEAAIDFAGMSRQAAHERAIALLDRVGIPDPAGRMSQYPHQLSGGQRQRVMIAMALMNKPKLLIADEPTTALDVTVQAQIMELLAELRRELGMAMILITHDLAVVAGSVDKVAVMYGGAVVEAGPVARVLGSPRHPYTRGLLDCVPKMSSEPQRLGAIPGIVPALIGDLKHCVFASRCAHVSSACRSTLPQRRYADGGDHSYDCILSEEQITALPPMASGEVLARREGDAGTPLLAASGINRIYQVKKSIFARSKPLHALKNVSLEIRRGETLALVGESGSGKSTLARIVLGLDQPNAGRVLLDGAPVAGLDAKRRARLMQPIFQDPYSSLNPRRRIAEIIRRPLDIHQIGDDQDRTRRVAEVMERVGLPQRVLNNYPNQMSGGQRQRVAIARALVMNPELLVCDEPTSALDVSVQAQILNLLSDLQRDLGLTYLLITHNISVVHQVASRIAVMNKGEIVEIGAADQVLRAPQSDYTRLLLSSVPELPDAAGFAERLRA